MFNICCVSLTGFEIWILQVSLREWYCVHTSPRKTHWRMNRYGLDWSIRTVIFFPSASWETKILKSDNMLTEVVDEGAIVRDLVMGPCASTFQRTASLFNRFSRLQKCIFSFKTSPTKQTGLDFTCCSSYTKGLSHNLKLEWNQYRMQLDGLTCRLRWIVNSLF